MRAQRRSSRCPEQKKKKRKGEKKKKRKGERKKLAKRDAGSESDLPRAKRSTHQSKLEVYK